MDLWYNTIFVGIVLAIATICGSVKSQCSTRIIQPSSGIAGGLEINSNIVIACDCEGDTQLEAWYFNGSLIEFVMNSNEIVPYATIVRDGYVTLTIRNFVPSYAGIYTCASSNGESTQVELTIVIPSK